MEYLWERGLEYLKEGSERGLEYLALLLILTRTIGEILPWV